MKPSSLVAALLSLSVAAAQVQEGELVIVTTDGAKSSILHYRPDGTLVEQYDSSSGPGCSLTAEVLANGWWVTSDICTGRVLAYDPVSDSVVLDFATQGLSAPADVEQFSDGTLLVVDSQSPQVGRYDLAGNLLDLWPVPFPCGGGAIAAIDAKDDVWVLDVCAQKIFHLDAQGNVLGSFTSGPIVGDIVVDPDGTLWLLDLCFGSGTVYHYDQAGNFLGSFVVSGLQGKCSLGLVQARDGTFWASENGPTVFHVDQAGNDLGSLTLPGGYVGFYMGMVEPERIGLRFCDALPNSTGQPGELVATGSARVADDAIDLLAYRLPPQEIGYVLNARSRSELPVSDGVLCLGGPIGRHTAQVGSTGDAGLLATPLDLTALPRPGGPVAANAGETWFFTFWHRDGAGANFTDAVGITLQ